MRPARPRGCLTCGGGTMPLPALGTGGSASHTHPPPTARCRRVLALWETKQNCLSMSPSPLGNPQHPTPTSSLGTPRRPAPSEAVSGLAPLPDGDGESIRWLWPAPPACGAVTSGLGQDGVLFAHLSAPRFVLSPVRPWVTRILFPFAFSVFLLVSKQMTVSTGAGPWADGLPEGWLENGNSVGTGLCPQPHQEAVSRGQARGLPGPRADPPRLPHPVSSRGLCPQLTLRLTVEARGPLGTGRPREEGGPRHPDAATCPERAGGGREAPGEGSGTRPGSRSAHSLPEAAWDLLLARCLRGGLQAGVWVWEAVSAPPPPGSGLMQCRPRAGVGGGGALAGAGPPLLGALGSLSPPD